MTDEPTAAQYAEMPVRITHDGSVYIGEYKIPGCIEEGGITVRPGPPDELNRLTIVFIVGEVRVDDLP